MTALNRFGLDVVMDIQDAPMPMVERECRYAAIEFCDYTLTWRLPLGDVTLVDGTSEYELDVPENSRAVTVMYAAQNGLQLLRTTEATLDTWNAGWRAQSGAQAAWYYLPDRTKIRIALEPSAAGTMELSVALKPTQAAKVLPDLLYDDHLEAIRYGALARLYAVPGKTWSNPQLASYYSGLFDKLKRKEKAERLNDYTRRSTLSILPGRRTSLNDEDC